VDLAAGLARVVKTGVPGAVGLAGDEGCVRMVATGVADVATGVPMTARHSFRIGSITKTFVAAVVLQLAAEGRLGLDDSLEQHLPGMVETGEQITCGSS
jgi:D-alanyl-D-alanine carboxypeptidase